MPKRKQTAGERVAAKYASGGDWGHLQRRDIARDIDAAIRKAAWEGFDEGMRYDPASNDGNVEYDAEVLRQFEAKYGPRPGRKK